MKSSSTFRKSKKISHLPDYTSLHLMGMNDKGTKFIMGSGEKGGEKMRVPREVRRNVEA